MSFQNGVCSCCAAGAVPFILCCCVGCPCINWGSAMTAMDPEKNCFVESIKSFFWCCCCPCNMRAEMREKYGIDGSFGGDFVIILFCYSCVGIQMLAEANARTGGGM